MQLSNLYVTEHVILLNSIYVSFLNIPAIIFAISSIVKSELTSYMHAHVLIYIQPTKEL